jgi:hypothetical protein
VLPLDPTLFPTGNLDRNATLVCRPLCCFRHLLLLLLLLLLAALSSSMPHGSAGHALF